MSGILTSPAASALLVFAVFAIVMAVLELAVRYLSPPEAEDPRLGVLVFWLWVAMVAAMTYGLWPFLERSERLLDRVFFGVSVVGWLGWKLGVAGSWEDSPREREEIWAMTVGTTAGCMAWFLRH
jgi:hypothetical protein